MENPFRRGDEESVPAAGWTPSQHPRAFVPEPSDELAREVRSPDEEPQRIDYFDDRTHGSGSAPARADRDELVRGAGGIPGAALPPSAAAWPARDLDEPRVEQPVAPAAEPAWRDQIRYEPPQPVSPQPHVAEAWTATPDRAMGDSGVASSAYGGGSGGGSFDDDDAYGYGAGAWDERKGEPARRRSAMLPLIGFIILGVAALLGGGFLFGALNSPATLAQQTSTPSATPSESAAQSPTPSATGGSPGATATAGASTTPVPQADNFTAQARPCATSSMGFDGCDVDGTTLDRGQVWVWVGFKNGQADNVIGVRIVSKESGSPVQDGSLELDKLSGCNPDKPCSGYINVSFAGLDAGAYTIQVTRDGDQVATSAFTVKT